MLRGVDIWLRIHESVWSLSLVGIYTIFSAITLFLPPSNTHIVS